MPRAIMVPHFPTNSGGAYLFRWHGGGSSGGGGGQREQRGRPGYRRGWKEGKEGEEEVEARLFFVRLRTLEGGGREQ